MDKKYKGSLNSRKAIGNMGRYTYNYFLSMLYALSFLITSTDAFAASKNRDDEIAMVAIICKIIILFTGPVGQAIVVIVLIMSGLSMFFGKLSWTMGFVIALGICIMFGAEQLVNSLLGGNLSCRQYEGFEILTGNK